MGFMEILLEAKRKEKPKKPQGNKLDVDVEDTAKEEPKTDETESPDDEEEFEDEETTDYSEEEFDVEAEDEDNSDTDSTEDDTANDDELDDSGEDLQDEMGSLEDETTDYGDEAPTDTSDDETADGDNEESNGENNEENESENEQENNEEETGKDLKLLTDFSNLYQMIVETLNKLNNSTTVNLITKQVITQVSKNLSNVKDMLYDYIILDYKKASYAQRLKQYAFFIEAVKINVSMLKKVSTSFSLGETK